MRVYSRRFAGKRGNGSADLPGLVAPARLDKRTKTLTRRLQPGDIAIIDHADLDRVSAESLLNCQVAAVVNVAASMTGRYPNLGPQLLVDAGIPLIDDVGPEIFEKVSEGHLVRLDGDTLYAGDAVVAKGTVQTSDSVTSAMIKAKAGLAAQIRAFMANTVDYIGRDFEELIDGIRVPELRTKLEGKHALVIARGYRHREDLHALRAYIREFKPVMVAVDGAADALLDAGYRPHLIVGDMDSVSDRALNCGAEIVVHAYPDGEAPGLERVQSLGLDSVLCPATGTSEDVALLLADDLGARLIVAVGMRYTLVEFLDKGRPGMASAVLTRMRVGDKIVEPKGVSRLYQSRISTSWLVLLVVAAAVTIVVALAYIPAGQIIFRFVELQLSAFWHWLTGLLP
ncbi:MAG TPA: putative cytokinetic ring protein SteA [Streptosporangiaceae bacterium]|nr:putative cytokinetic ring protein SteA [Streptosporangiaceae bacterium]